MITFRTVSLLITLVFSVWACTPTSTMNESLNAEHLDFWLKQGFSQEQAQFWTKLGYSRSTYIAKALNKNLKDAQAFGLTFDQSKDWFSLSLGHEISDWMKQGVKTPEEASRWRELLKYLVDSYDLHRTAGRWVANGYTPDSAEIWLKAKYKSADAVAALEKAGFSPSSFDQEWSYRLPNLSDDEVLNSIPWLKAGKTFDEAKLFVATFGYTPEKVASLSVLCPNGILDGKKLISTSPYETKGSCYIFATSIFQLLGRYDGLGTAPLGNSVHLVFQNKKPFPENTIKTIFAIGTGEYKYNSNSGFKVVINLLVIDQK